METRYLWIGLISLALGLCYLQASAAVKTDKSDKKAAPATQAAIEDSKFTLKDVPEIPRQTLKQESQGEELDNVKKKKVDGKTVYQAKTVINGVKYTLQVDEQGKLVSKKVNETKTKEEKTTKKASKDTQKAAK